MRNNVQHEPAGTYSPVTQLVWFLAAGAAYRGCSQYIQPGHVFLSALEVAEFSREALIDWWPQDRHVQARVVSEVAVAQARLQVLPPPLTHLAARLEGSLAATPVSAKRNVLMHRAPLTRRVFHAALDQARRIGNPYTLLDDLLYAVLNARDATLEHALEAHCHGAPSEALYVTSAQAPERALRPICDAAVHIAHGAQRSRSRRRPARPTKTRHRWLLRTSPHCASVIVAPLPALRAILQANYPARVTRPRVSPAMGVVRRDLLRILSRLVSGAGYRVAVAPLGSESTGQNAHRAANRTSLAVPGLAFAIPRRAGSNGFNGFNRVTVAPQRRGYDGRISAAALQLPFTMHRKWHIFDLQTPRSAQRQMPKAPARGSAAIARVHYGLGALRAISSRRPATCNCKLLLVVRVQKW